MADAPQTCATTLLLLSKNPRLIHIVNELRQICNILR